MVEHKSLVALLFMSTVSLSYSFKLEAKFGKNDYILKYHWDDTCEKCSVYDPGCTLAKFTVFPPVGECQKPIHKQGKNKEDVDEFYYQIEQEFIDGEPMYIFKKFLNPEDNKCLGEYEILEDLRSSEVSTCFDNEAFGIHAFTITKTPLKYNESSLSFELKDQLPEDRIAEAQASFFPMYDFEE
eukprot:Awhi_evm1s14172